jgi:hypothetical protein
MKLKNLSKRYSHCTFAVEMLLTGVPIDRFIACSVPCLGDVVLPTTPLPRMMAWFGVAGRWYLVLMKTTLSGSEPHSDEWYLQRIDDVISVRQ